MIMILECSPLKASEIAYMLIPKETHLNQLPLNEAAQGELYDHIGYIICLVLKKIP